MKVLADQADVVLVVGSPNSSNSNRLRELAERCGSKAYLIDDASMLESAWLTGAKKVGVTAGASAPESLVEEVISALQASGADTVVSIDGRPENITFSLPKELRIPAKNI